MEYIYSNGREFLESLNYEVLALGINCYTPISSLLVKNILKFILSFTSVDWCLFLFQRITFKILYWKLPALYTPG